jgi:hypothetical protein
VLLFFHDIGIPLWIGYLWLFGLITCPIFSGIGIYYLKQKQIKQSTFVLSLIALLVFFLLCHLINILPDMQMSAIVYLAVPFGFVATATLGFIGLIPIALLIGIALNFLSIIGLVRFIEKKFE